MSPHLRVASSGSAPLPPEETPAQISRSNRYAGYEAVRTLHQQAISQREIARRLKLSRQTVQRFLTAETFPERSRPPYRGSVLDPYKPYILERWLSQQDEALTWRMRAEAAETHRQELQQRAIRRKEE